MHLQGILEEQQSEVKEKDPKQINIHPRHDDLLGAFLFFSLPFCLEGGQQTTKQNEAECYYKPPRRMVFAHASNKTG